MTVAHAKAQWVCRLDSGSGSGRSITITITYLLTTVVNIQQQPTPLPIGIQIQSIIIIKYETISTSSQHVLWFGYLGWRGDIVAVVVVHVPCSFAFSFFLCAQKDRSIIRVNGKIQCIPICH